MEKNDNWKKAVCGMKTENRKLKNEKWKMKNEKWKMKNEKMKENPTGTPLAA